MKFKLTLLTLAFLILSNSVASQSLGTIQPNTNAALPASYNFQEYVYAEPDDQGDCLGNINNTAEIQEVFVSQTHRHPIGHPFLFTIGHRPFLLQIAVTGSGPSPDITVEGKINGVVQGTLCLNGPENLTTNIDLAFPNFDDYFSVTIPKAWVRTGLELSLKYGADTRTVTPTQLNIGPYTEVNLVILEMDILDYNTSAPQNTIINEFLEEIASAIPASVVRFGTFPMRIPFPEFVVSDNTEQLIRLTNREESFDQGSENSVANLFAASIQEACGDFINTIYFGNTLNLNPGGWGGGRNFVAADYDDVFIHEFGHSLSLLHWGDEYGRPVENDYQFLYPYGGETNDGGGIGETWTFNQDKYAFVNPKCEIQETGFQGLERSDCMQREFVCKEVRGDVEGPWEGFGDYSAYCMHQYIAGGAVKNGQVPYRNGMADYQIPERPGFPYITLENGKRKYTREASQPQDTGEEDWYKLPGEEQLEQDVYLIYGSLHPTQDQANILYDPIQFEGTQLPLIDPTDPTTIEILKTLTYEEFPRIVGQTRDITLKLNYVDGSVKHVLVPYHTFSRNTDYYGIWRNDVAHFAVTVPGDVNLCQVEMYHRPFIVTDSGDDIEGNINYVPHNITAENFMDGAILKSSVDFSCNCPGTPGYVLPGTLCDDGNPDTYNDIADGSCTCAGTPISECELVGNGGFDLNFIGWWNWGCTPTINNGVAIISDIDLNDAGIAQGPFLLTQGQTYEVSFTAYANANWPMDVIISTILDHDVQTVNLTTTNQVFTVELTMNDPTTDEGALEFQFSGSPEDVILDNISFREISCEIENPCQDNVVVMTPIDPGFHQATINVSCADAILTPMALQFQAGSNIDLLPGFEVGPGIILSADIEPCSN